MTNRDPAPTWATTREALGVVFHRPHLRKTVRIALVVGTILFAINHGDTLASGRVTVAVIIKGLLTYVVPFIVSNVGVLIATQRAHR